MGDLADFLVRSMNKRTRFMWPIIRIERWKIDFNHWKKITI